METNSCTWDKTGLSKDQINIFNPEDFIWHKYSEKLYPLNDGVTQPIIKLRFNIGQTVFFMKENKVNSEVISGATVHIRKESNGIYPKGWYNIQVIYGFSGNGGSVDDKQLYSSKEELLKSL